MDVCVIYFREREYAAIEGRCSSSRHRELINKGKWQQPSDSAISESTVSPGYFRDPQFVLDPLVLQGLASVTSTIFRRSPSIHLALVFPLPIIVGVSP